jgi:hypothetical protein
MKSGTLNLEQLTFWSEELPAKHSALQDSDEEWMTSVVNSPLSLSDWLHAYARAGSSGKMSPVFCPAQEDETLVPSSGRWANSGMGMPTECWTLSSSESPNAVEECSLLATLETGVLPRRFFLSAKACSGILRRADKRNKKLPPALEAALRQVAQV